MFSARVYSIRKRSGRANMRYTGICRGLFRQHGFEGHYVRGNKMKRFVTGILIGLVLSIFAAVAMADGARSSNGPAAIKLTPDKHPNLPTQNSHTI